MVRAGRPPVLGLVATRPQPTSTSLQTQDSASSPHSSKLLPAEQAAQRVSAWKGEHPSHGSYGFRHGRTKVFSRFPIALLQLPEVKKPHLLRPRRARQHPPPQRQQAAAAAARHRAGR
jgi:hypothetical protein